MSAELLAALDLGTTSTRALVVGPDGAVRARAARPLPTRYPAPGRVEQDPEALWTRSLEALREALAASGCGPRDLAGLGIATQRASAVAWDARTGRALCPALGWQDTRTRERVAELRARGVAITTLPTATKYEWLLGHEPAVREAARSGRLRLGTPDAWLTWRLTGGDAHWTDPGQASCTGLYDPARGDWSESALALFGVEPALLPRVAASCAVAGETPTPLLGGPVPVAARAGDQQAACFAQGVHAEGEAKLTLGTAAMLDVHTGARPAAPPPGAYPLALWRLHDGRDAFCLEGTVVTAGALVDWLVGVGLLDDAAALDRTAAEAASSDGVDFVPALQGLGTPYLDDAARGLLGGLTRGTTRAHVVRAALEGIAQRCADLCDVLAPVDAALRVDGGLARSDALLQALADATGRAALRAAETESTALGAAWLAGLGAGRVASPAEVRARRPRARRFEPAAEPEQREAARRRWASRVARARSDRPPVW